MTIDEPRIRLEGALETVEAGTARYRDLLEAVGRVHSSHGELEALASAEGSLELAAAKVSAFVAREPNAELQLLLEALGAARRAFRSRVRAELTSLEVRVPEGTLEAELELLRLRAFPPADSPPVLSYRVSQKGSLWPVLTSSGAGVALSVAMVIFGMGELGFSLALAGAYLPTVFVMLRRYSKVELFRDRIHLTRFIGRNRVLPLSKLRQLDGFKYETTKAERDVVAFAQLLDLVGFTSIGPTTLNDVVEVEAVTDLQRFAAIVGDETVTLIDDKNGAALDAAAGHRASWEFPRAWHLAYLLDRAPEAERSRILNRINVAGLTRTATRADFERDFRRL